MSVTKPSVKKQTIDGGAAKGRRSALLASAADVFVAKGFHDAKVSDIVAAAGVAQGTFYLYFKNKAEALEAIVGDCCQDIATRLDAAATEKGRLVSVDEVRGQNIAFLIEVFESLERDRRVSKLILARPDGAGMAIDKALDELKRRLVETVRGNLVQGIEAGYYRELNTAIVAEAIVGMVYHIAFERFVLGRRLGTSIRQLAEEIVDFELMGIACEVRSQKSEVRSQRKGT